MDQKEFKQNWMRQKKEQWKNKRMYGQFVGQMPKTKKEIWNWQEKPI